MKTPYLFLLTFCLPLLVVSQSMQLVTGLSPALSESSGLSFIGDKLFTHGDSGNDAVLFEIDTLTGNPSRTIAITGATNIDWEDIQVSGDYLYIGDIGNNDGTRTNLRFYRVLLTDILEPENDAAAAEAIPYFYNDQTDFPSQPFATQFDAEAFIAVGQEIYIFTKNWDNEETNVYYMGSLVGPQEAVRIGSFDSQGLVTGAWYDFNEDRAHLVGYTLLLQSFTIAIDIDADFSNGIFNPTRTSASVPNNYSTQIEAITSTGDGKYFVTAEQSVFFDPSGMYRFSDVVVGVNNPKELVGRIFPNPAIGMVHLDFQNFHRAEIFDSSGRLIYHVNQPQVNLSQWESGVYIVKVFDKNQVLVTNSRIAVY